MKNIKGIIFCSIFALAAYFTCKCGFCQSINLNSLTLAIIAGMIIGNVFNKFIPAEFREGITFSAKRLLRLAIILYGFRITFQQIFAVGLQGFWADVIMLATTYLLGYYLGTRVFKLDKDLLAVSTVVLFGTISMFLYPFLAGLGIVPESSFGIYIGSTIHEVAQVVAAGSAVSPQVCDTSVIVKLTRVMMLVPYLFLLGLYLSKKSHTKRTKVPMPWFAILFVVMCGFNSLNLLPAAVKSGIIEFDVFLLTVAMFALGVETNFEKIKGLGLKPILLAGIMFIWLVVFGACTARFIV